MTDTLKERIARLEGFLTAAGHDLGSHEQSKDMPIDQRVARLEGVAYNKRVATAAVLEDLRSNGPIARAIRNLL